MKSTVLIRPLFTRLSLSLSLIQQGSLLNPAWLAYYNTYATRVIDDGGTVQDASVSKTIYKMLADNDLYDNTKLLITPEGGISTRTSGVNVYVPKAYDFTTNENDLTQTTESSQPSLGGNIAPNEFKCLKNVNGDSRYMTHPQISFASDEAWAWTGIIQWDGTDSEIIFSGGSNTQFEIDADGKLKFTNESAASDTTTNAIYAYSGKNIIIHLIADGAGSIEVRINDILFDTLSVANDATWDSIFDSAHPLTGCLFYEKLFSGEQSSAQTTAEYTALRALIPEIENVTIGTQTWATSNLEMVATPMGNVIQEMQDASAVVKLTESTDRFAGWTTRTTTIIDASGLVLDGTANSGAYSPLSKLYTLAAGVWVKVSLVYTGGNAGSINMIYSIRKAPFEAIINLPGTSGTKVLYGKTDVLATNYGMDLVNINFSGVIENVIVQELGWADSQELYDGLIAQGSTEQEALEAAAMWRHPNNDTTLSSIYGKHYNGYAKMLIRDDIDAYNTANPTTPWGWHIPTETEWDALDTYIEGDTDVLKESSDEYWTDNTGTNETGFTALPAGWTDTDGDIQELNEVAAFWDDEDETTSDAVLGLSIRLIQD